MSRDSVKQMSGSAPNEARPYFIEWYMFMIKPPIFLDTLVTQGMLRMCEKLA
jgi:hypothetical protein